MKDIALPPQTELRPPEVVMRLKRMGQFFPTRLSFLRVLMRDLADSQAVVTRPVWEMSAEGFGHAVYQVTLRGHVYSLVMVTQDLPPEARSDRVIATAWDAAFVLFDGVPQTEDIARICAEAPKQEAGRFTEKDLVLSRANKSVRLWEHVVGALRAGHQPDAARLAEIGYLMRTTAVYGNGKFGIADRHIVADRPGVSGPFAVEMLTVWLIRHATIDLVSYLGGQRLDDRLARGLGIGNATGLGMAPFLVSHPVLLNNWMMARETALARARALGMDAARATRLSDLAERAGRHLEGWRVPDPDHDRVLRDLAVEWAAFAPTVTDHESLDAIYEASLSGSLALQELVCALLIEVAGDVVDGLSDCMGDPFGATPHAFEGTAAVKAAIEQHFGWATDIAYDEAENSRRFWYVSAAKLEPRIGDRYAEAGADLESPLHVSRCIAALYTDLPDQNCVISAFLASFPQHAWAISRVALAERYPYADIRDNLIAADCLPIDMLRCKLSFFGATRFDPKSDLWTRVTLAQGAPLAHQLDERADDWWLPEPLA